MKEIVFIYDHFYPDYTAGGPITALGNLALLLQRQIKIKIITSAFEYKSKKKLPLIVANQWCEWNEIPIWYAEDKKSIRLAMDSLNHQTETVYLNGLFSLRYFLYPLWLTHRLKLKVILTPRGMLQSGAIKNAKSKKFFFLVMLRISGLLNGVRWHATDVQESIDIEDWFGKQQTEIVPDVPIILNYKHVVLQKQCGRLRLVYFSLITEKKNLSYLLELLNSEELSHVELDIIGPVKDQLYWEKCKHFIKTMKNATRIIYRGEITPDKIGNTLPNYHALILPTHGENFGHAIIEMLACSRPVIISDKTPWLDLEQHGAGYSLSLEKDIWIEKLSQMVTWNDTDFSAACSSAFRYYQSKFNFDELKMRYLKLFSHHS